MSGHSKWANIKNRKGAQDKKRSETFTKSAKLILTAIRQGGGRTDIEANNFLRVAIDKAKEVNMPRDNIERLLKSFEDRKSRLANYLFEAFGPGGVPFLVEVETDNKNRTVGEIKLILKENGGSLGENGSVAFLFERVGEIELDKAVDETAMLELIDIGVKDFDDLTLIVDANELSLICSKIKEKGMVVTRSEIVMRAKLPILLEDEDILNKVLDLASELEDNEDVISVYSGMDYAQKT